MASPVLLFLSWFLMPDAALAYIDPATGAMIINGIIVAIVTVFAFFRRQIRRFFSLFKKSTTATETRDVASAAENKNVTPD